MLNKKLFFDDLDVITEHDKDEYEKLPETFIETITAQTKEAIKLTNDR